MFSSHHEHRSSRSSKDSNHNHNQHREEKPTPQNQTANNGVANAAGTAANNAAVVAANNAAVLAANNAAAAAVATDRAFKEKHHPLLVAIWNTDRTQTNKDEKLKGLRELLKKGTSKI